MANRFTDSRKWDDPWFRKLPCKYKAFFIFLLDKCNHAGIWKVDFESATFHIGEEFDHKETASIMAGRIIELKDKWFIPKFISFQYQVSGPDDLNPENRVHKSVIDLLTKEGAYKGLIRGVQGCKDKDYDKDKDKDKDKDITKHYINKDINNDTNLDKDKYISDKYIGDMFREFWSKYPRQIGESMAFLTFKSTIKTKKDFEDLMVALNNYIMSNEVKADKIKNGDRWIEDWRGWINLKPKKVDPLEKWIAKGKNG